MNSLFQDIFQRYLEKILAYICISMVCIPEKILQWQGDWSLRPQIILWCAFNFHYCTISELFFLYRSIPSQDCNILDKISHNTEMSLALLPPSRSLSPFIFVLRDFNVHLINWLNHSNLTNVAGIQNSNSPVLNERVDFPTWFFFINMALYSICSSPPLLALVEHHNFLHLAILITQ